MEKNYKNYKKEANEVLKKLSYFDYKSIIFEIAKSNPYALIKAYNSYDQFKIPYIKNVKKLIDGDRFIEAIKLVREETRCGLKEAKDFCDKIKYENIIDVDILNV
jgi:hypothetical protein